MRIGTQQQTDETETTEVFEADFLERLDTLSTEDLAAQFAELMSEVVLTYGDNR